MPKIILKNKSVLTNAKVRLVENADSAIDIGAQTGAVAAYDGIVDICLAPAPNEISCDGALNRTPIIEVTGSAALAIGSTGEWANYNTPEELITALEEAGLTVEIVPEDPYESTEIFLTNTKFDLALPLDGSKQYAMDVTVSRDGMDEIVPFAIPLTNPPYAHGSMDFNLMPFMMWLMMALRPTYTDILEYFNSAMFENNPEIMNAERVNFTGNLEEVVESTDMVKITFLPKVDLAENEVDFYDTIFGADYPHGVTVVSYGKKPSSNLGKSTLSKDNVSLAYTSSVPGGVSGVRRYNLDLTYTTIDLPTNYDGNTEVRFGKPAISDDGTLVANVMDRNPDGSDLEPLILHSIANDAATNITLDWNGFTKPTWLDRVKISTDKSLIIASGGEGNFVFAMKHLTMPNRYDIVKVTSVFEYDGVWYLDYVNDSLLIGRGISNNNVVYTPITLAANLNARTVELTPLTALEIPLPANAILTDNSIIVPNGMLNILAGKLIHIDFTDINALTYSTLFTDETIVSENGMVPATSITLAKVNELDKLIYIRTGTSVLTTVYDIDLTTLTLTNKVETTIPNAVRIELFVDNPAFVYSVQTGIQQTEHPFILNADNTLTPIQIPYTP